MGSYGKLRPRKVEKSIVLVEKLKKAKVVKEEAPAAAKTVIKKAPVKKTVAKKTTSVKATNATDSSAEKK